MLKVGWSIYGVIVFISTRVICKRNGTNKKLFDFFFKYNITNAYACI